MANNIDTTTLTALITEFRRLQAKDSVTPESLGAILQRIADLLATAGSSVSVDTLISWLNRLREADSYINALSSNGDDRNIFNINAIVTNPVSGETEQKNNYLVIPQATTEHAGVMRAQQVVDLNTLLNRYNDTITPAVEIVNNLNLIVGSIDINNIDNIENIDNYLGRLVQVKDSSGFSNGYIMHIVCQLYVTQIFYTHYLLDENGELITNTHDEKGFHIYKRSKDASDSNWSAWQVVGGDEFAALKQQVDAITNGEFESSVVLANSRIAVEVVDGCLKVYGAKKFAEAGYVPYLFRNTRRRNRLSVPDSEDKMKGSRSKGWHLYGSHHTVMVKNSTAYFSSNDSDQIDLEAKGYSDNPNVLVRTHVREDGNLSIPWGRSMIKLFDKRSNTNRMLRLRFAIGYAPLVKPGWKISTLNLVSNLAEFSVVYNPVSQNFTLSR